MAGLPQPTLSKSHGPQGFSISGLPGLTQRGTRRFLLNAHVAGRVVVLRQIANALIGNPKPEDWIFASPAKDGKQPYWPGTLYRAHLAPAAKAAGISGKIGWHTFATLLKANGEDVKTVQELLRHANSSVTMNVYAQGVTELKRKAHHRIVQMVTGGKHEEEEESR